ncbi:MAG: hypothetical protein ABIP75_16135 [Pyrinomonadaceae bacterium]
MKFRLIAVAFVILFSLNLMPAQNAVDIKSKFGTPTESYLVIDNIWMSPSYATNGQVCRMELFAKRHSAFGGYRPVKLTKDDFNRAIEKLVPELIGSEPTTVSIDVKGSGGDALWNRRSYEQISIVFITGFNFNDDAWLNARPTLKFNEPSSFSPVTKIEFLDPYKIQSVRYTSVLGPRYIERGESAVISWRNRKCSDDLPQ